MIVQRPNSNISQSITHNLKKIKFHANDKVLSKATRNKYVE